MGLLTLWLGCIVLSNRRFSVRLFPLCDLPGGATAVELSSAVPASCPDLRVDLVVALIACSALGACMSSSGCQQLTYRGTVVELVRQGRIARGKGRNTMEKGSPRHNPQDEISSRCNITVIGYSCAPLIEGRLQFALHQLAQWVCSLALVVKKLSRILLQLGHNHLTPS